MAEIADTSWSKLALVHCLAVAIADHVRPHQLIPLSTLAQLQT